VPSQITTVAAGGTTTSLPIGMEVGIRYSLIGPDGTRASFNDTSDRDFVGYLEEVTGLDGAEVRESSENIVEGDGAIHSDFFYGRRPVTLSGLVDPSVFDSTRNEKVTRLLRACDAMRADATLSWQATGGVPVYLNVRRQNPPRVTGGRVKNFQISLVAADPRIYSEQVYSATVNAGTYTGGTGLTSPLISPLQNSLDAAGSIVVNNQGSTSSPGILTIFGPITNPRIINGSTGEQLALTYTLAEGDSLAVDVGSRTVTLNGSTNRYSALDFPNSIWWELVPGPNAVRLEGSSFTSAASLSIVWRHAWN
jgi:hypothetical protein